MRHCVFGVSTNHFQLWMQIFQPLMRAAHNAAFPRHRQHFGIVHSIAKGNTILQAVAQFLRYRFRGMAFETPPAMTSVQVKVEKLTLTRSPQRALIACSSGRSFSWESQVKNTLLTPSGSSNPGSYSAYLNTASLKSASLPGDGDS